ncbi:hypothetical protein HER10_EVM0009265 [Colletotrichum scovillei]|uniref:Uncharacterized protein n=1 Tax=Colletotrichum scovillei TaxID=1209932 RepID=A0A9P7R1K8_9PEZI|nr:uncharacterized protein HER10_EVM0009265 [Colletotrichum scovillei]KAF4776830.1 hypothetical protein HER10_EVM0009265 [Colletotrichum scovillei]KAG7047775.1 hypothetical protein JMJ77_0011117 [Colletotrichum scovillei]KAG7060089.1 hypothetical protein JMJ78_0015368 [Colletotrichum scovillei]KAG7067541.1 hypothetical protein JMJ76_0008973 [Colletotrichum scovillei]
MAQEPTIVLETHIYSNPPSSLSPGWTRSFHLRLSPQTATKSQLLSLVRASVTRLGRADPIVEAQITLYWTSRTGRVVSIPGDGSSGPSGGSMATVTMPVWQQQQPPLHLMTFNVGFPALVQPPQPLPQSLLLPPTMMDPPMPMAMTYSNGVNYLHSYGNPATQQQPIILPPQQPAYPAIVPAGQQTWITGGGPPQLTFVNVNVPTCGTGGCAGGDGGKPVISDVIREARLDTIAEAALGGMLEWACGPTGLKLIVVVDVDGRDVVPVVVSAAPVAAAAATAAVAETPPIPVAASPSSSPAATTPAAPASPASAPASPDPATPPPPATS